MKGPQTHKRDNQRQHSGAPAATNEEDGKQWKLK